MFKNRFRLKANIIFFEILTISFAFLAILVYSASSLYKQALPLWEISLNKVESVCGCMNHLSFFNHPFMFAFFILSGAGLIFFIFRSVLSINEIIKSTKNFISLNLCDRKNANSIKLNKIAGKLGLAEKIVEIVNEKPVIFCFGFINPRICISSKLVKEFSAEELTAVLRHEKSHMLNNEPMKLFLAGTISKVLFFIPGLKPLLRQYSTFSELAADESATRGFRDKGALINALCKIIKIEEKSVVKDNMAITFFAANNERIDKLVNSEYNPKFAKYAMKFAQSMAFLIFIFIAFNGVNYSNGLIMQRTGERSCSYAQTDGAKNQSSFCINTIEKSDCDMDYKLENKACEEVSETIFKQTKNASFMEMINSSIFLSQ